MSGYLESIGRRLGYVLSLPERVIRSLAAVAGGTTSLLTETLFPPALRGTTLYRVFLGDAQHFVITRIAEIKRAGPTAEGGEAGEAADVQKKMVGGALEAAGLLALHVSPLWVFAFAGDAAAGTNVFLQRLVERLRQNGVLSPDAQVAGLDELLVAIQEVSRRSAEVVDAPPLSREDLARLASEMRACYGRMFAKATDLVPRFEQIWGRIEQVARRENIAPERVLGILAVQAASWAGTGFHSMLAAGQTGAELFGERILDGYAETLDKISAGGLKAYVTGHMQPFLQAAAAHFGRDRKTWTESLAETLLGGRGGSAPPSGASSAAQTAESDPEQQAPPSPS